MNNGEESIHDELRATFSALSDTDTGDAGGDVPAVETATETPAGSQEEVAPSGRDERGRFAPKAAAEEPQDKPKLLTDPETDPTADVETGRWTADKPPSSWTPKARERWNEIDPELRQEIIRREEAAVNGVRRLQEQFAPVEKFIQKLNPLMQDLLQNNIPVEEHVTRVLTAERGLRAPDIPSRFQALLSLADQYGIPLRDVVNASVGQQVLAPPQTPQQVQLPPEIAQEVAYVRQYREELQNQALDTKINSFASQHEFFDDVRYQMGQLIATGVAQSMEDAYEQAVWMVPEVREVLVEREKASRAAQSVASRQAAAARVASPGRSSEPHVPMDVSESDDIYATVRGIAASLTRR